ncbi:hypothetical protein HKD37_02G003023 [Glycine soja]
METEPGKRQCMSRTTTYFSSHSQFLDNIVLIAPSMLCLFPCFVLSLTIITSSLSTTSEIFSNISFSERFSH